MKFWILPNCDEYDDNILRQTLIDANITIGKEEDVIGGICFRECDIPEEAWKVLDQLWVKMYIWGLESGDEETSESNS